MTQRHMGSCEQQLIKISALFTDQKDFILKSGILKLWLLLELDYVLVEMGLNFYGSLFRILGLFWNPMSNSDR